MRQVHTFPTVQIQVGADKPLQLICNIRKNPLAIWPLEVWDRKDTHLLDGQISTAHSYLDGIPVGGGIVIWIKKPGIDFWLEAVVLSSSIWGDRHRLGLGNLEQVPAVKGQKVRFGESSAFQAEIIRVVEQSGLVMSIDFALSAFRRTSLPWANQ